jgi:transposase InsO family protein
MTGSTSSQRAALEEAVRTYGGYWDTDRGLRALRDAGHHPQAKHTRRILRDLTGVGLLVKVEDWPVRYRAAQADG